MHAVHLRANTSICPRLSAAIFVCAENVVKIGVFFCIMANFMLYIGTHSIGTCASLLHVIIIIIIIIISHHHHHHHHHHQSSSSSSIINHHHHHQTLIEDLH